MLKALIPALLLAAPTALVAAPQGQTHELLRAPAGKQTMLWRQVNRPQNTSITCPPDSTKSFWCGARRAELAARAAAQPEQLSER